MWKSLRLPYRHPLQHKQKGRGGDERCQKDRQPSASWGKGISWEAGIAQGKGRHLLLRSPLNGGRLAPRSCLEAGRCMAEHQEQLCPFFLWTQGKVNAVPGVCPLCPTQHMPLRGLALPAGPCTGNCLLQKLPA